MFPGVQRGWWYLREGFVRLGCQVIDDPALLADGYWSPPRTLPGPVHIAVLKINGKRVWYDCSDFAPSHPELGQPYFAKNCLLSDLPDVQPIGQYLGTEPVKFLDMLPELRALTAEKTIDVLAVFSNIDEPLQTHSDIYNRAAETGRNVSGLRRKVVEALHGKPGVVAGLWRWGGERRPEVPERFRIEPISPEEHWRRIAQSKVVVCLPGVGGESTRLRTEALAIGSCVVTVESRQAWPGDSTTVWLECVAKDLVHQAVQLSSIPGEVGGGRDYFDAHLTPEAMAERMLKQCA
jgi:hypothetical protein